MTVVACVAKVLVRQGDVARADWEIAFVTSVGATAVLLGDPKTSDVGAIAPSKAWERRIEM